jgi:hypothetical protein
MPCSISFKLSNKYPDSISPPLEGWDIFGYYFKDTFPGIKEYEIATEKVTVKGLIRIPDTIDITSHKDGDTINIDKDATVTWTGGCDWYEILCIAESGNRPFGYYNILTQNKFTMQPGFFPDSIYSIYFWVLGNSGTIPLPGNKGNITGEGCGFIFGSNNTGHNSSVYLHLAKNGKILQSGDTTKKWTAEQIKKIRLDSLRNRILYFHQIDKKT